MAIVLYKPTIPELLRDQPVPRAPMVQLDIRLLHTGMLGHKSGSAADVFKHFALRNVLMLRETPEELDRTSLEVTSGESSGNSLAVIPWANHSASIPSTSLSSLEKTAFLPVASQTMKGDDEMGEAALESEAMDEEGVSALQSFPAISASRNYGPEPWQHYGVPPEPQFGSVTWSH